METLLRIQDIEKYYGSKSYITKAVDHISFEVQKRGISRNHGSIRQWKKYAAELHLDD